MPDLQELLNQLPANLLSKLTEYESHPYYSFKPRPDQPHLLDQQESFVCDRKPGIAVALGGTGSGKTYLGAKRTTDFLLDTPPPEENTPFWIISKTMEMTCKNVWSQNLKLFLPKEHIRHTGWHNEKNGWPKTIILKPHTNGNNWMIHLKSYDQGREALQGSSIGGFWLDEVCPFDVLTEVIGRTRKWSFPGSQIFTMTPLEPAPELESIFNDQAANPNWTFYRLNSEEACKAGHITQQYLDQIKQTELEELIETRLTGAFASYQGAIYRWFRPSKHVIKPFDIPPGAHHYRGVDLGFNDPTFAVFGVRMPDGVWYIYREYCANKTLIKDHVKAINEGWKYGHPAYCETWCDHDAQDRAEFADHGLMMLPAWKDSITGGISVLQHLFKDDKIYIFDTCRTLINQLRGYIWNPKKHDEPIDKDNHGCDALRYMTSSREHPGQNLYKDINKAPIKARFKPF